MKKDGIKFGVEIVPAHECDPNEHPEGTVGLSAEIRRDGLEISQSITIDKQRISPIVGFLKELILNKIGK